MRLRLNELSSTFTVFCDPDGEIVKRRHSCRRGGSEDPPLII
jgi:hypothetical protein